jgi:nitrogenase-stabilizing/protective protein
MSNLQDELSELSSAEDFLQFFEVPYEPAVVHVNRLHILQRYHDYLERAQASMPEGDAAQRGVHRALLERAYRDFVTSTAIDERVFKVLKNAVGEAFVPMTRIEGVTES